MFLPLLFKHPLTKRNIIKSLKRYFLWNVSKVVNNKEIVYTLIGNTKINLGKSDTAALVNYYTGLYEFEEMCFMLHFLRKDDLFIDVGANIGVFSLLASGHIGCRSIAFEPIPSTYQSLKSNFALNNLEDKVTLMNIGLGGSNNLLKFTNNQENSINKVADKDDVNVIEVEVKRLDDVINFNGVEKNMLLKVDVEGFETEVLAGANNLLKNPLLKAIIIELNGAGLKYGFDENQIKRKLEEENFQLWYYMPFERLLSKEESSFSWGNAIYIRDKEFINKRLKSASNIEVFETVI